MRYIFTFARKDLCQTT
jgi:hypothetical protein